MQRIEMQSKKKKEEEWSFTIEMNEWFMHL